MFFTEYYAYKIPLFWHVFLEGYLFIYFHSIIFCHIFEFWVKHKLAAFNINLKNGLSVYLIMSETCYFI